MRKAQGSLEYLIIIAAVLAVAAIVVLFLTGSFGSTADAADISKCKEAASRCAVEWSTSQGPPCSYCDDVCPEPLVEYCKKGEVKRIVSSECEKDADCNDGNECTTDGVCENNYCLRENIADGTLCNGNEGECISGKCFLFCGNGFIDAGEFCDGVNLNGYQCNTVGDFDDGTLKCSNGCTFDTSGCWKAECTFDTECYDDDPCTNDVCINSGTASAECINEEIPSCLPDGSLTLNNVDRITVQLLSYAVSLGGKTVLYADNISLSYDSNELVLNGDFENGLNDWGAYKRYSWQSDPILENGYVRLEGGGLASANNCWARINQSIDISSLTSSEKNNLVFSFDAKNGGISSGASCTLAYGSCNAPKCYSVLIKLFYYDSSDTLLGTSFFFHNNILGIIEPNNCGLVEMIHFNDISNSFTSKSYNLVDVLPASLQNP